MAGSSHLRTWRSATGHDGSGRTGAAPELFFSLRRGGTARGTRLAHRIRRQQLFRRLLSRLPPAEREGTVDQDPVALNGAATADLVLGPPPGGLYLPVALLHSGAQLVQAHNFGHCGSHPWPAGRSGLGRGGQASHQIPGAQLRQRHRIGGDHHRPFPSAATIGAGCDFQRPPALLSTWPSPKARSTACQATGAVAYQGVARATSSREPSSLTACHQLGDGLSART
jgi:hypothetical protein